MQPPLTPEQRSERARHAVLCRHYPNDPGAAEESLRRLRALRLEQAILAYLGTPPAPDLSERRRLARLLRPGTGR